ncbi:MAG: hypothetical protein ACFCU2_08285 [Acidimicrobiia bacterium]
MKNLKRSAIVTFVAMGLFVGSGIAVAETDADVPEEGVDSELMVDTLFSFGYDLINGLFLWNISSIDEPCALPTAEDAEPTEQDDEPVCELTGGEVAGSNGQVNHGMFMKLFNSLYEGTGRGCVVRHLAQSDLGKGDQQVKGGDEEADSDLGEAGSEYTIDFTTIETLCQDGDGGDAELEDEGKGKPPWAGKPEGKGKPDSPGNSGSAPGKNK